MAREEWLSFNGVNGATGGYLAPARRLSDLAAIVRPPENVARATAIAQRAAGTLGLPFGKDPAILEEAGWAVVAPESETAAIQDALAPLIAHRKSTIGDLVRVLSYAPGESRAKWLARHKVAAGTVDPARVPFYLLLAGGASRLPFQFVHELAVEYAVGRIEFDSADEYRRYAEHVVRYESSPATKSAGRVEFFGVRHDFDQATQLSADHLIRPLAEGAGGSSAVGATGFTALSDIGAKATKQRLRDLLAEPDETRVSLLFTASHGVGYPAGDERQRSRQGALVCQDWREPGVLSDDDCFAADDLPQNDVEGLVAFLFACYGGGTPGEDLFARDEEGRPVVIASEPFVAALPRALLLRGALAVVGHVDRAWGYSIAPPEAGDQIAPFNNFLGFTLSGYPIGYAMKDFSSRYAALSVSLANLLDRREYEDIPDVDLVRCWIERNDAEAYVVIGDPAARISKRPVAGGHS